jgi:hypothetical protein
MSNLRKYLASTDSVDLGHVLAAWDIPLDENITAYEANVWLHAQLAHNFEIVETSVEEGLDSDDWDVAVGFVWKCLRYGIVPHEYVSLMIKHQQVYDKFFV